jgi:hypothetical protein
LSISGKYVPLDWATGKPHDCPERAWLRLLTLVEIDRYDRKFFNLVSSKIVPGLFGK